MEVPAAVEVPVAVEAPTTMGPPAEGPAPLSSASFADCVLPHYLQHLGLIPFDVGE